MHCFCPPTEFVWVEPRQIGVPLGGVRQCRASIGLFGRNNRVRIRAREWMSAFFAIHLFNTSKSGSKQMASRSSRAHTCCRRVCPCGHCPHYTYTIIVLFFHRFIFLRLICPAILNPRQFNLINGLFFIRFIKLFYTIFCHLFWNRHSLRNSISFTYFSGKISSKFIKFNRVWNQSISYFFVLILFFY